LNSYIEFRPHPFGTVPSVAIGALGTLLVVGCWMKLFPALTQREKLSEAAA
jgi:hypothetical protein